MTTRRNAVRIIYELLAVFSEGVSKTQAVYRTNLNFKLIEDYLDFLTGDGYLQWEGPAQRKFRLTLKGKRLLMLLVELERQIEGFRATPSRIDRPEYLLQHTPRTSGK